MVAITWGIGHFFTKDFMTGILSALVEQKHDDNGIIFPEVIAPFELGIVIIDMSDEEQVRIGNDLYKFFKAKGLDVVLDDRDVRAGIKFKDSDLIGIPQKIIVGKKALSGIVEVKRRYPAEELEISIERLKKIF